MWIFFSADFFSADFFSADFFSADFFSADFKARILLVLHFFSASFF